MSGQECQQEQHSQAEGLDTVSLSVQFHLHRIVITDAEGLRMAMG
jgi:hypothetical protein